MTENGYIQGAGDDSEGWSHGLTPAQFWANKEQLLSAVGEDLPGLIQQLKGIGNTSIPPHEDAVRVIPTDIHIGTLSNVAQAELYDGVVICSDAPPAMSASVQDNPKRTRTLHIRCSDGKLGSRALRQHLPRLVPFIKSLASSDESPRLLFASSTGKDLSVGAALAVLCIFFDDKCKASSISCSKQLVGICID